MNQSNSWEVSFFDLLMYVLQRWRMLIVFLIIGAVAAGGYGYLKNARSEANGGQAPFSEATLQGSEGGQTPFSARKEFLQGRLTEDQRRQVELVAAQIRVQQDRMQDNIDYVTHSYYMDLDTFSMDSCDIQFYLLPDKEDVQAHELAALVTAYSSMIENALDQERLQELLPGVGSETLTTGILDCELEYREFGILTVRINVQTDEEKELLLEEVKKLVEEGSDDIEKLLGKHEVTYLGTEDNVITYKNIRQEQNNTIAIMKDLQAQINAAKSSLAGIEEKEYLDFLLENPAVITDDAKTVSNGTEAVSTDTAAVSEDTEAPADAPAAEASGEVQAASSSGPSIRGIIKYAIIGALLGLVIAIILIIIRYVTASRVRRAEDLEKLTGMRTLGCFAGEGGFAGKHHTALDRALARRRNKKHPVKDYEETLAQTASQLSLIAEKKQMKNVMILSAGAGLRTLAADLQKHIPGDLQVSGLENLASANDAAAQLKDAECVVLMAQQDVTSLRDIYEARGLCSQCGLPVIGSIILE